MAALTTTVHSPLGAVLVLPGRVPQERAIQEARRFLQTQVEQAQAHLEELSNWYTTAERGTLKAKRFEEMPWDGQSS